MCEQAVGAGDRLLTASGRRFAQENIMSDTLGEAQLTTQEILAAIELLGPVELEKVAHHVSRMRLHRATGQEAELLQIVRSRLPIAFQRHYHELMQKRKAEMQNEEENQELLSLTNEAEAFNTRQLKALVALAEMRHTHLETLMYDLSFAKIEPVCQLCSSKSCMLLICGGK